MRVLLINSDLAANRGDRAIAEGIVALVRGVDPVADIAGLSEAAERDAGWLGIRMLPQGVHTLALWEWVSLLREARRADVVLWGGGELLKDYTNRAGVWYWSVKIALVSRFARRLIGAFQGIGPTSAPSSRRRIARTVARADCFVVRDAESRDKLIAWGAPADKIVASYDSAVVPVVDRGTSPAALADTAGIPASALDDFVAIAPRDWFHYRRGGLLPARWRPGSRTVSGDQAVYRESLRKLVDACVEQYGTVVLVPMHMGEDPKLCAALRAGAARPEAVHVLDSDSLSPAQLRSLLALAQFVVAFRLHAGIVAASAGTPAITYYYVDKGRLFADQAGMAQYAQPIEEMLRPDAIARFREVAGVLAADAAVRARLDARVSEMRADAVRAFSYAMAS